jgi:hypothetical protein
MIRIEKENDWLLFSHPDHAALAGEFARHWKNENFAPPEPFTHVLDATARHDDSWEDRDASPLLTHEMNPSAFSEELVGTYDAFEEIDLHDYLGVRGRATEATALRDPYSALLVSMHTVNLLTVQADLTTLKDGDRAFHKSFIDGQINRQAEIKAQLSLQPDIAPFLTEAQLLKGFKFLQACDSFSLFVGVAFSKPSKLQHAHPRRDGSETEITFTPKGNNHYVLSPYPLDEPVVKFNVPYRRVPKTETASLERFQAAYTAAAVEIVTVTVSQN